MGSGAAGGSIRLITKDARDYLANEPGMGAKIASAYQSASDAITHTVSLFKLSEQLDTVLHVSHVAFSDIDVVGDRDAQDNDIAQLEKIKNNAKRTNVALKSTWQITPVHAIKGKLDWSETQSDDQPYGQRQDLALIYPTLTQSYHNDYLEASVNYAFQPQNHLFDLDVQAFFTEKNSDKETRGFIPRGSNKQSFDADDNWKNIRKGIRFANLSRFTGVLDHNLAIEINYEREDFNQTQIDLSTAENAVSSFYGDSQASDLSIAVIDQSELFSQRLLVTLGGRYNRYKRDNSLFNEHDVNDDGEFSNEIGLTFKATDYLNFYVKKAQAFRAPSVQELYKKDQWRCHIGGKICYQEPQPDLKPETSDNLEFGFGMHWQQQWFADQLSFKFIYFDNEIENYIDNVPFMYYIDNQGNKQLGSPGPLPENGIPVATHRDYSAKNISQLTSKGLEVELDYQLGATSAYIGYSTINMDVFGVPNFFLGTVEQQWQPFSEAPADKLTINLNYQLTDELNIGAQRLAYAKQQRLSALYLQNGYGTQAYNLYNLNLRYEPATFLPGLTLVAGIDNLTNERYLRAPASEARDPAQLGRNYKLTLHYQF